MSPKKRNFFHTTQQKKWREGSYKNPYFETTSRQTYTTWLRWGGGIALGFGVLFSVLYAPWVRIQTYAVEGTEFLPTENLEATARHLLDSNRYGFIPKDHLLFLSEKELQQELFEQFRLDRLEVKRRGYTLQIQVTEKLSRAVWQTKTAAFVIDEQGVVVNRLDETDDTTQLTIIHSVRDEPVYPGETVLEPHIIDHIFSLLTLFQSGPLIIDSLEIDSQEARFLRIHLSEGFSVFFDPTIEMTDQYHRLVRVLQGETTDPSSYEYIDVRFGERVYIKDR